MRDAGCLCLFYMLFPMFLLSHGNLLARDEVDGVIEDELTRKLAGDLLQSIERKFQVDLERSVDLVLLKIKLLLQNGTLHIQDRLVELQDQLDIMRKDNQTKVDTCLTEYQNETAALADKGLHQMVLCGYALIGHDPAEAVKNTLMLKNVINVGLKPVYDNKAEVYDLLKVCGHDHDSLKKVVKCVISKSPLLKSAMMDITSKLIDGVVTLTKLMAHGAMHEACLIEVIKTTEEEAFKLVHEIKNCFYERNTTFEAQQEEIYRYLQEGNATVLDVGYNRDDKKNEEDGGVKEMIRRMLAENEDILDTGLKRKLKKLQKDLGSNQLSSDLKSDDS